MKQAILDAWRLWLLLGLLIVSALVAEVLV